VQRLLDCPRNRSRVLKRGAGTPCNAYNVSAWWGSQTALRCLTGLACGTASHVEQASTQQQETEKLSAVRFVQSCSAEQHGWEQQTEGYECARTVPPRRRR
jgi:hypothetical protein